MEIGLEIGPENWPWKLAWKLALETCSGNWPWKLPWKLALEVCPETWPWELVLKYGPGNCPWKQALQNGPGNWPGNWPWKFRWLLVTIRDSDGLLGQPKLVYIQLSCSYYDNNWAIELGSIHWHSATQISGEHVFIRLSPLPSSSHHDLLAAALAREIISYHLYAHIGAKNLYGVVFNAQKIPSETLVYELTDGKLKQYEFKGDALSNAVAHFFHIFVIFLLVECEKSGWLHLTERGC